MNVMVDGCMVMFDFNEDVMCFWDYMNINSIFELSSISYNEVVYIYSGWFSEDK